MVENEAHKPKWLVTESPAERDRRLKIALNKDEPGVFKHAEKMLNVPVSKSEIDIVKDKPTNGRAGRKKAERDTKRQLSFFESDGRIYEQVYREHESKSHFIFYDTTTGEVGEVSNVGEIYPFELKHNESNTIGLAENAINFYKLYGDANDAEADLLTEVEEFIYRYVDLDNSFRTFAACYVLLSWLFDRFYSIPYLRLLGDFGTGKSRALDVIGGICYRPVNVSGATSAAGIFRIIDRWRGTLILDESDFRYSDETVDIVRILNQGFEKNRTVLRVNTNDMSLEHFQAFCPKIISSRKKFQDEALESRCLSTITKQTSRADLPFSLGKRFFEERNRLRKKLLMFRLKNYGQIDPEIFNIDIKTEPRLKQITLPFFVLFANNRELLKLFTGFIEAFQQELVEDRANTPTGQVVGALFDLWEQSGQKIEKVHSEGSVIDVMNVMPGEIAERVDMKPRTVGTILKGVGLRTRVAWLNGGSKRLVEYNPERFGALRARYVPG
jgi:hypothetical protein